MEEYEVELIDYLRVMWKGKWIILACLVVAIVVSAAILWTRPDEYSLKLGYQYDEQLSDLVTSSPSPIQVATSAAAAQSAIQEANTLFNIITAAALPEGASHVTRKVTKQDDEVQVVFSGVASPAALSQLAKDFTSLVHAQLVEYMRIQMKTTSSATNLRVTQLTKERDMLAQQLTAAMASNDPLTAYLAQNVADLDGKIVQDQALIETLSATDPADLFSVQASQGNPTLASPNRRMSLAVAGVLGLFVGILLAFFVHYLVQVSKAEHKRT